MSVFTRSLSMPSKTNESPNLSAWRRGDRQLPAVVVGGPRVCTHQSHSTHWELGNAASQSPYKVPFHTKICLPDKAADVAERTFKITCGSYASAAPGITWRIGRDGCTTDPEPQVPTCTGVLRHRWLLLNKHEPTCPVRGSVQV